MTRATDPAALDLRNTLRLASRQRLLDECYDTVWAIAASPFCDEFQIGYTHLSGRERHAVYWKTDAYQHFAILADKLSQADARWLECELQTRVKKNADEIVPFEKYHPEKKHYHYQPSTGGVLLDRSEKRCSVYMAWREGPKPW